MLLVLAWVLLVWSLGEIFFKLFPQIVYFGLSFPAAQMAALYFSAPCYADGVAGWLILWPLNPMTVTQSCSGATYFLFLFTLLSTWRIYHFGWRKSLWNFPWILLVSYGLAIGANTMRIILSAHTSLWTKMLLTEQWQAAVHCATGVVCFLTIFIFAHLTINRRTIHAIRN
jgi:exosortase/archaeosortase family protein